MAAEFKQVVDQNIMEVDCADDGNETVLGRRERDTGNMILEGDAETYRDADVEMLSTQDDDQPAEVDYEMNHSSTDWIVNQVALEKEAMTLEMEGDSPFTQHFSLVKNVHNVPLFCCRLFDNRLPLYCFGKPSSEHLHAAAHSNAVWRLYFDGGCRHNGSRRQQTVAGGGCSLQLFYSSRWTEVWHGVFYMTTTGGTNNVAESLTALIGLQFIAEGGLRGQKLEIYGDSELIIQSLQPRSTTVFTNTDLATLQELQEAAIARIESTMMPVSFHWVDRKLNPRADMLANRAMDERRSMCVFNSPAITELLDHLDSFDRPRNLFPLLPRDSGVSVLSPILGIARMIRPSATNVQIVASQFRRQSILEVMETDVRNNFIQELYTAFEQRSIELIGTAYGSQFLLRLHLHEADEYQQVGQLLLETIFYPHADREIPTRVEYIYNRLCTHRQTNCPLSCEFFFVTKGRTALAHDNILFTEGLRPTVPPLFSQVEDCSWLPSPWGVRTDAVQWYALQLDGNNRYTFAHLQESLIPLRSTDGGPSVDVFQECGMGIATALWTISRDVLAQMHTAGLDCIHLAPGESSLWNRCYLCPDILFRDKSAAIRHIKAKHPDIDVKSLIPPRHQSRTPYRQCPGCNQVCMEIKGLSRHLTASPSCRSATEVDASTVAMEIPYPVAPSVLIREEQPLLTSFEDLEIEAADLLGLYGEGLYTLNRSWVNPLASLCSTFLKMVVDQSDPGQSELSMLAFMLIWGMIQFLRTQNRQQGHKGRQSSDTDLRVYPPVIDFLRDALARQFPASYIVQCAQDWRPAAAERARKRVPRDFGPASDQQLQKQIEHAGGNFRLHKASAAADALGERLLNPQQAVDSAPREEITMDEARKRVAALHPPATALDILPEVDEETSRKAIQLKVGEVRRGAYRLNTKSSNGFTGATNAVIVCLFTKTNRQTGEQLDESVTAFFNLLLSGGASANIRQLWAQARETLLPKPGTTKMRPVGIGDAFDRFMGRVVHKKLETKVGREVAPLQVGVGVPSGCEIAARLLQAYYDKGNSNGMAMGHAVASLDAVNAFNSINRQALLAGIERFVPELKAWFLWFFGSHITLRWSSGDIVGKVSTGFNQGLALGGILWAVGNHVVGERLRDILCEEEERFRREQPTAPHTKGAVIFEVDDGFIAGETVPVFRTALRAHEAFSLTGLTLSPHKSAILAPEADLVEEMEDVRRAGFQLKSDGITVLGCPIGSSSYVYDRIGELVHAATPVPDVFRLISPRVGYRLLHLSYAGRPMYLARIGEYVDCVVHPALREFDNAVDLCLAYIADIPSTNPHYRRVRSLRVAEGGCGMMRYYGALTEGNKICSRKRFHSFVETHNPAVREQVEAPDYWLPIQVGAINKCVHVIGQVNRREGGDIDMLKAPTVEVETRSRQLRRAVSSEEHRQFKSELQRDPRLHPLAASFVSAGGVGTGAWLVSPVGLEGENAYFGPQEFRMALSHRLLCPLVPIQSGTEGRAVCSCGGVTDRDSVQLNAHPFHERSCPECSVLRRFCHDKVVTELWGYLEALLPGADIRKEQAFRRDDRPDHHILPDLTILWRGMQLYVDVGLVDPAARTYISKLQTHKEGLAAARDMEARKRRYYEASLSECKQKDVFYPFVIEATGRLGPSAVDFLKRMRSIARDGGPVEGGPGVQLDNDDEAYEEGQTHLERTFLHNISVINAKYGGKMALRVKNSMRYRGVGL